MLRVVYGPISTVLLLLLLGKGDGTYYAFYVSAPTTYPSGGQTTGRVVTVATSEDGKVWTRPMLDIVQYGNYTRTNILLKLASEQDELSQISVFADVNTDTDSTPSGGDRTAAGKAHAQTRAYQMFVLATSPPDGFDAIPDVCKANRCMYRFRSTDALHWTPWAVVVRSVFSMHFSKEVSFHIA